MGLTLKQSTILPGLGKSTKGGRRPEHPPVVEPGEWGRRPCPLANSIIKEQQRPKHNLGQGAAHTIFHLSTRAFLMSVSSSPSFTSIYLPCYLQLPSQTQIWACYSLTLNLQHNIQFPLYSRQFPPHPHLNILLLGFLQLFLSTGDQITHQPLQSCGFFSGLCAFGQAAASSQISLSP